MLNNPSIQAGSPAGVCFSTDPVAFALPVNLHTILSSRCQDHLQLQPKER